MNASNTQRMLQLNTTVGSSDVWITKLKGKEGFSTLSHYVLELASQQPLKQAYDLIGTTISFSVKETSEQAGRDFNGLIVRFSPLEKNEHMDWYYYEIEVVPWLWLLTQRSNCRIFPGDGQRKAISVKQVLEELFSDYSSFKFDLSGISNQTISRDFWVQYNETDFQFFSRLVENYGIFYYFLQSQDSHQLILGDQNTCYQKNVHQPYYACAGNSQVPQIFSWTHSYRFTPNTWTLNSHNSDQPSTQLQAKSQTSIQHNRSSIAEHYCYANTYLQRDDGTQLSKLRMESEEIQSSVAESHSNIVALAVGEHIKLNTEDFPQEEEHDFILTQLTFSATDVNLPGMERNVASYSNHFSCIPATKTYRPQITTHKPNISQLHEAVVTGAENQEIYTDEMNRLRIQFAWDRLGNNDANASCWVRSVSSWEGVLRVGTPVLVGFLNNDIDQPIIMGPLYDAQQKPLFTESTMSGLKRRHGLYGDDSYYNELRFNDKKDQGEVFLHACHDMNVTVENAVTTTIKQGNDRLTISQGDLSISIDQGKCEITVQGDVTLKSNGNITLEAAQALKLSGQTVDIQAQTSVAIKGSTVQLN